MSYTIDATSGWAFPATAAEWTLFLAVCGLPAWSPPQGAWSCQEASGSLADGIGSNPLVPNASPAYGTAITGFSRKAVTFTDGTTSQKFFLNTGPFDASANSVAWLVCLRVNKIPSGTRIVFGGDGNGTYQLDVLLTSGNRLEINCHGSVVGGTHAIAGAGVFWAMLVYDRTNGRAFLQTTLGDTISATYSVIGGDGQKGLGAIVASVVAGEDVLAAYAWSGSGAERTTTDVTALFAALQAPTPPTAARGTSMSAVLFPDAEAGSQVTYSWSTDILAARNGKEWRLANRNAPHESYDFAFTLSDDQIALIQGQLITAAALGDAFGIALAHESLRITAAFTGSVLAVATTAYSDWCYAGQTIVVLRSDGTATGTGVVQSTTSTTIIVDTSLTVGAGDRIMPVVPCYLEDPQALGLYAVNAGSLQLKARATYWGNATSDWSPAGASVTTYTDASSVTYPVWDRGLDTNGTLPHAIDPGTELADLGGVLLLTAPRPVSNLPRRIDYSFNTDADRQFLKAFHGTVRGRQCIFLLPTWRPDLVPIGDASTGTLKVKSQTNGGTDYAGGWFAHPGLKHIQILLPDGTAHYRTVTDAADNLDGTQTLQLDSALTGTIAMVSVLETCRLDTDDIVVRYGAAGVGAVSLPVVVVQQ